MAKPCGYASDTKKKTEENTQNGWGYPRRIQDRKTKQPPLPHRHAIISYHPSTQLDEQEKAGEMGKQDAGT